MIYDLVSLRGDSLGEADGWGARAPQKRKSLLLPFAGKQEAVREIALGEAYFFLSIGRPVRSFSMTL